MDRYQRQWKAYRPYQKQEYSLIGYSLMGGHAVWPYASHATSLCLQFPNPQNRENSSIDFLGLTWELKSFSAHVPSKC